MKNTILKNLHPFGCRLHPTLVYFAYMFVANIEFRKNLRNEHEKGRVISCGSSLTNRKSVGLHSQLFFPFIFSPGHEVVSDRLSRIGDELLQKINF